MYMTYISAACLIPTLSRLFKWIIYTDSFCLPGGLLDSSVMNSLNGNKISLCIYILDLYLSRIEHFFQVGLNSTLQYMSLNENSRLFLYLSRYL